MIRTKLSVLMAEQDIRQDELSARTGISKATLSNVANNKTSGIQYEILDKLALFFGIKPSDFFEYIPYNSEITGTKEVSVTKNDYVTSFECLTLTIFSNRFSERPLPFNMNFFNKEEDLLEIDFIDSSFDHLASFNPDDDDLYLEFLSALTPAFFKKFSRQLSEEIKKHLAGSLFENGYDGKILVSLGSHFEPEYQFIVKI